MIKKTGLQIAAESAFECWAMSNEEVLVKVGSHVLVASKASPEAKFTVQNRICYVSKQSHALLPLNMTPGATVCHI